ncbi:MAG: PmoA family protein [Phycisphaerales bacterium]|nr:PmoA family protein [Phycisphaerales bacterium]
MTRVILSGVLVLCAACGGPKTAAKPQVAGEHVPMCESIALCNNVGTEVGTVHLQPGKPPALWPVRSIGGLEITRAYPFRDDVAGEAHDHPHHRSMWMAHGDVNGVDYWHAPGRVEHDSIERFPSGAITVNGRWVDAQGTAVLASTTLFSSRDRGGTRFVNMVVTLTPIDGPVHFGDTKEGTLAIRLAPELRFEGEVANGSLANSEGATGKAVWGKPAQQIQIAGTIDGAPIEVKVGYMQRVGDGPMQTGVRWHARTYGLIAANPFGDRAFERDGRDPGGFTLEPGQTLKMFLVVDVREGDLHESTSG